MLLMMTMSAEAIALFARALRRLRRVFYLDDDDDDDDDVDENTPPDSQRVD
jgi:hypothetical protein